MRLASEPPEGFDGTCVSRYMRQRHPASTRMDPSPHIVQVAGQSYGINWVLLWCLAYELTDGFAVSDQTVAKNFLLLPDVKPRSWTEGINLGTARLAVAMGFNPARLPPMPAVVMSAQELVAQGKAVVEVKDLATLYPEKENLPTRVMRRFEDVLSFWAGEGSLPPPNPILKPTPEEPKAKPEPVKPKEPEPEGEKKKAGWKVWLAGALGTVGTLFFFAKWFLPGGVVQIVHSILEILKALVSG